MTIPGRTRTIALIALKFPSQVNLSDRVFLILVRIYDLMIIRTHYISLSPKILLAFNTFKNIMTS